MVPDSVIATICRFSNFRLPQEFTAKPGDSSYHGTQDTTTKG